MLFQRDHISKNRVKFKKAKDNPFGRIDKETKKDNKKIMTKKINEPKFI